MNYTENYHLPQWEKTDRVLMEDFNRMCADMESGLDKTARDAAAATAAAKSANAAAAARAQTTADTALSKADAARKVADAAYCPSSPSYVVGSYVGPGYNKRLTVELGFRPKFVIITGQEIDEQNKVNYAAIAADGALPVSVLFLDNGFQVLGANYSVGTGTQERSIHIYDANKTFHYIAFR